MCIPCGVHYTGVARLGGPCATCDGFIVDFHAEIARLARTYDPVRRIVYGRP